MVRDMTTGKPISRILVFCLPLLLGNLFQQFYNMADSIIVGQFLGTGAFAAVGATGSINFLILGFAMGMTSGFSIPVSQDFGAGDLHGMRKCVAAAAYMSAAVAVIMTLGTVAATRGILLLMNTPADILEDAYAYIVVIFGGMGASILYNLLSAVLRALGDSKTPLIFLIIASVLNVALDLLFIAVIPMGVAGAAWATIIAQAVSGILCLLYIIRKFPILRMTREERRLDWKVCSRLLGVGVPMGLQFSITAVGSIILQTAVNALGSAAVASISAAMKIYMIVAAPIETVGVAMATYCGQNYGAGKIGRVRKGVRQSTIVLFGYCVVAFAIIQLADRTLALLFLDGSETQILDNLHQFLTVNSLFFPALSLILIYRNALQGLGFSRAAMAAGAFELVGRSLVAFCLVGPFGFFGVCFANPAAWIAADLLLLPLYLVQIRRLSRWEEGRRRLSAGVYDA